MRSTPLAEGPFPALAERYKKPIHSSTGIHHSDPLFPKDSFASAAALRSGTRGSTLLVVVPDVPYARSGDVSIAYQVVGDGPFDLLDGKVAGLAVSIGARVAAQAGPGEVLVSQTVKDLVAGSGIEFADRGVAELKGVRGEWQLFSVTGA
jgi:hypothetical protein